MLLLKNADDRTSDCWCVFFLTVVALIVIRQQRSSACEVEFTMEMCEYVLRTLRSTWDLTPSDLTHVASVIMVEEEVSSSL